jgi:hypothetical protein
MMMFTIARTNGIHMAYFPIRDVVCDSPGEQRPVHLLNHSHFTVENRESCQRCIIIISGSIVD